MTQRGFGAQLVEDLGPAETRVVLDVFRRDLDRMLEALAASAAAGDAAGFHRSAHGLAGAAAAVGAAGLEGACRAAMVPGAAGVPDEAALQGIRAAAESTRLDLAACLARLPPRG